MFYSDCQGVSFSQKFCGKHSFPFRSIIELPNVSQNMTRCKMQKVIRKSKFKIKKSKKNKHRNCSLKSK